ncbi:hypothetical protein V490_06669 [Pseudogymnoascus sp. VKM F-3557]|nr:hypothetical protein V490_06669 [Pseudogymnoascus sp. VKM F-3557]
MADDGERPIRVLSLDGGGVRGLSAILILGHIMRNINYERIANKKEPQEPWQYFDLMGGTSTGGIIAIMLGRLRMTIPECIEAYTELSKAIFTPRRSVFNPIGAVEYLNGDGMFDSEALEKQIKTQIKKSKVAEDDDQILLKDPESPCKVCVFALRESNSKLAILRTYDYLHASQTLFEECKVWEACRATSAAPTFFDSVAIGPYKQKFIDGGLGYNNPIVKVYDEAQNIWPDRTVVVTSIGTGEVPGTAFGGNLKKIAESIAKIVTGCDVVAYDFYNANKAMVAEERYFRLSVTHGLGNIGLEEHKHIAEIVDQTQEYLSRGELQTKLKQCIKSLLLEHGNTLPLLNDVLTCLESLSYKGMNFRKENIVSANDDTCGWLLENKNYARWVQSNAGLLWIQGKGGAGKSTLMKYIYEKIQMPTDDASGLRLSFFFHGRGEDLQGTRLGMFKSLLLQLYKGDPISHTKIKKEFDKNSEDGIVDVKWEWTEKKLEELFSNLICQIAESKKVTIFVDALDEAGEVVANDLAVYLTNLYEKVQQNSGTVKICFSSRHYPIVSAKVADNQKVIVEHENEHGIRSFVQREFEQNLPDGGPIKSNKVGFKLESDVAAKANGVFQWVCLVLPIIFKADREAESLGSIKKILNTLPKDLNEMYRYILQGLINQEQQTGALKLFRWICFAARQLSIEEVQDAMAVDDSLLPLQGYNLKDSSEYVEHGMETRIKALSGGLIEIRAHSSGTVVQVGHQTIRDFLLKEGLEILSKSLPTPQKHSEGLCHNILARLCINYLWTKDVQQLSRKLPWDPLLALNTLPLLQYAISALFFHASNAEHNGYHQDSLPNQFGYRYTRKTFKEDTLEQGVFSLWCTGGRTYCLRDYFGVLPSGGSTLLHIASMANISTTVKTLLKQGAKVDEKDDLGQQAIHYAARGGATEVSEVLIKAPRRPKFLYSAVNAEDNNSITPLQLAARNKKDGVMRLLITEGATIKCLIDNNSTKLKKVRGNTEETVSLLCEDAAEFNAQSLYSVAVNNDLGAVRVLLAEGADLHAKSGEYGDALAAASLQGHKAVVKILLEHGAEVNAQIETFGNALAAAAYHGHIEVVNMLLDEGANINAVGGIYGNALVASMFNQKEAVTMLLLERGAEPNVRGGDDTDALTDAAMSYNSDAVRALLEAKADYVPFFEALYNARRGSIVRRLGVVLPVAAWIGRLDIVERTIEFFNQRRKLYKYRGVITFRMLCDSRLNARGSTKMAPYDGYTVLQLSAAAGHSKVVATLLAAGADVNATNAVDRGCTALQVASRSGNLEIVESLVKYGADVNARAAYNNGRTALQAAAEHGHFDIVATLLAAGADVNSVNNSDSGTALQAAAKHGYLNIVERLLDAGADVNAVNDSGTALRAAAEHGHLDIVEKLLDAGADVNAVNDSDTALQAAARRGHLEIVAKLLAAMRDPSIRIALQKAEEHGYLEMANAIRVAKANRAAFNPQHSNATTVQVSEDNQKAIIENRGRRGISTELTKGVEGSVSTTNLQVGTNEGFKELHHSLRHENFSYVGSGYSLDVRQSSAKEEIKRTCNDASRLESWIRDILEQERTPAVNLQIDLYELVTFVQDEYDSGYPLRRILTITGSSIDAFAGTAESYVKYQWAENGIQILDWISQLITLRNKSTPQPLYMNRHTEIRFISWNKSNIGLKSYLATLQVTGTLDDIISITMQLSWMAAVFRKPSEEGLAVSRAKVEYNSHQELTSVSDKDNYRGFTIRSHGLENVTIQNDRGSCWNPIFHAFVIADGFGIPSRSDAFSGIELPLYLLAALAQLDYPLQYLDSFVLKGRKSAAIPVSSCDTEEGHQWIQWHLIQSNDGSDLSMEVVHMKAEECELVQSPISFESSINRLDHDRNRHFLGLYQSAAICLGTQDSHAENIRDGIARLAKDSKIRWLRTISPSFSIALPGIISVGAATPFEVRLPNSARRRYSVALEIEEQMMQAFRNLTILYDTNRRIAWLVPEIYAILHLIQAHARYKQHLVSFPRAEDMTPSKMVATCRDFLKRESESPHQATNHNRFQRFEKLFREMKEDIILDRHISSRNSLWSEDKLVGVGFNELSKLSGCYDAKRVKIHKENSGGWVEILTGNAMAQDSDKILTLFCSNLGAPICPSPQARTCTTWVAPIAKMDYLITTVYCTEVLTKRHGAGRMKLSPSLYWAPGIMDPFDECPGQCCDRLQKLSKKEPIRKDLAEMLEGAPEGAVIFGGKFGLDPNTPCNRCSHDAGHRSDVRAAQATGAVQNIGAVQTMGAVQATGALQTTGAAQATGEVQAIGAIQAMNDTNHVGDPVIIAEMVT